jgi:hypothetical protein
MTDKIKIGDKVSVICRFGETGTIKEINKTTKEYGIEFDNLSFLLYYKKHEFRKLNSGEQAFSWFRIKHENI